MKSIRRRADDKRDDKVDRMSTVEKSAMQTEELATPPAGESSPTSEVSPWTPPRWGAPAVGLGAMLLVLAGGFRFGLPFAILTSAGFALVGVVWLLFRSLQALSDEPGEQTLVAVRPTQASLRKRAALGAIKELEYERSIGNISEEDYENLVARYRDEAKVAMRLVDEERLDQREKAERLAKSALTEAKLESLRPSLSTAVEEDAALITKVTRPVKRSDRARPNTRSCAACGVDNDGDARFCKLCGQPMKAPS
ncbi:MAG: hypothetical protein NVSMB1_06620 [Polyangiales bacterium]